MRRLARLEQVAAWLQRLAAARGSASSTFTPYFSRKYDGSHRAPFQLQDELADQPLLVGRSIGAAQRDLAALYSVCVRLPRVAILHVDTIDVTERRHAESDHVGALPQPIGVEETRRRRDS